MIATLDTCNMCLRAAIFHGSKFSNTAKYLMTEGHFSEGLQMEAFPDVSKVFENTVKCIEFLHCAMKQRETL